MKNEYGDRELVLIEALLLICKIGCMQSREEEQFFCKHDGSAHSCYCPAGIAQKALELSGVTDDLKSVAV